MTSARLPGLDGLRGLLVPVVLTYHLGVAGFGGFLALEGFFVLSGFLITLLLLDHPPTGARGVGRWWLRRWRRLVPAATVVVVVTVVVFRTNPGIVTDAASTLTWWRNWAMAYGSTTYWSSTPSPLKHTWSLSVEEQFYAVFPIVVVAAGRLARWSGRRTAAVVAATCGTLAVSGYVWQAVLATAGGDLNRVYLGSDTRAGSILLGCAVGAVTHGSPARRRPASPRLGLIAVVGLAVIVVLGFVLEIEERTTYRGGLFAASVAWAGVTVAASRPGPVASLLGVRPLRWLGVRSYGIYLWSWPVQVFVESHRPGWSRPAVASVTIATACLLAEISLRGVERPLQEHCGWASSGRVRAGVWAGGTVVASGVVILVAATAPTRATVVAMTEDSTATAAMSSVGAMVAAAERHPTTAAPIPTVPATPTAPAPDPAEPDRAAAPLTVLVGGDSQAATIAFEVRRRELPAYIGTVADAGVLGCGVLVRTEGWMVDNPTLGGFVDGSYCRGEGSAESAEILGLSAHPDWLVITSGGYEQSHRYRAPDGRVLPPDDPEIRQAVKDALDVRIRRANDAGTRVALLEFVCPGRVEGEPRWDEFTHESIAWHNSNLREVAAAHPGTITIPATDLVCQGADATGRPTPEKAEAWGTDDRVHVTDSGQAWVWRVQIGPALWAASVGAG